MADFTREEMEEHARKFERADLRNIDLRGAKLVRIDLRLAKLSGANLIGSNLQSANLQGAILLRTEYSEKTIWPEGFDPEAAEVAGEIFVGDDD